MWFLIPICVVLFVLLAFAGFYFTRSSKSMPKNFLELKTEIQWQAMGIYGLAEDFIMRSKNKVGKSTI